MGIDRASPTPLYYQLELELLEKIKSGEWAPGDLIPTEVDICASYGVSRTTARQALANLVRQGMLVRKSGKGSYVRERRVVGTMQSGFLVEGVEAAGFVPRREVLRFEVGPAEPWVLNELRIAPEQLVLSVRRLLLGNDSVFAYADIFIPHDLAPGLTKEHFEQLQTYEALEQAGFRLGWGYVTLEARLVSKDEVSLLEVPVGSPVLTTTRLTHLESGRPFELLKWVGRADMVAFSADFENPRAFHAGLRAAPRTTSSS